MPTSTPWCRRSPTPSCCPRRRAAPPSSMPMPSSPRARPSPASPRVDIGIVAIATETAKALFVAGTYGGASARLIALTWGAEDLSAELGAEANRDTDGQFSRSLSARPHALPRRRGRRRGAGARHRLCGFSQRGRPAPRMRGRAPRRLCRQAGDPSGAGADHQRGVHAVGRGDRQAQAIVAAFAATPGAGVVGIDGVMYDRPHLVRAQQLLARADKPA